MTSGLIPDAELTALRAAAAAALDIPGCVVQYPTYTNTALGHQSVTWTTRATVAASMRKPSAALMQLYSERIGTLAQWVVRMPYGTVCNHGDQLLLNGQTLMVEADLSISSYSTVKMVLCAEVMEG